MSKRAFGRARTGEDVDLYTLRNANGLEASITNYGASLVCLRVPDHAGALADVVLGFDSLDAYAEGRCYFGAIVGRCANRIHEGRLVLDGVEHRLSLNDGGNHLHGGHSGFDRAVWAARERTPGGVPSLELSYRSRDGDEGYPGNLAVTVAYSLDDRDELRIEYAATTDRHTVVNLTHHSYFNLAGQGEGDVLGHELMIDADRFTPVDAELIPTGELRGVAGSPFDFRTPTVIGARIDTADEQLSLGRGYDHNFVLNGASGALRLAARVREPAVGRVLEVLTTEPGLQFYSGNFLHGGITGKGGRPYGHRYGFSLEPQHFPDSPNQPGFPSVALRAGERYRSTTVYRLGTAIQGRPTA